MLSFNTHLVSEIFYEQLGAVLNLHGNDSILECNRIADAILQQPYDVLVLSEVFDEDARECLIDRLGPAYPAWAGGLSHAGLEFEEDSGIFIMSRLPFAALPISEHEGIIDYFKNIPPGTGFSAPFVNHTIFNETAGFDSLAAKGLIHVRVVAPGDVLYDIIGTHMQAPADGGASYESVRQAQLAELKTFIYTVMSGRANNALDGPVIIAGDLNINGLVTSLPDSSGAIGTLETPTAELVDSEYGRTLWSGFENVPFYDVWRTTSDADHGVTHFPSRSERLDYFLMNGGGYYVPGPGGSPRQLGAMVGYRIYPQWVRTALRGVGSDHDAVALEVGPSSTNGAPWNAQVINEDEFGGIADLTQPGANHWYRLPQAGTYSIGLPLAATQAGVRIDVFPEDDLGRPLEPSPLFDDVSAQVPYRVFTGGSKPIFARVYAPAGDVTGAIQVSIRRHNCSTRERACVLKPSAPLMEINRASPDPARGSSWFVFRTAPTAPGVSHSAELTVTTAPAVLDFAVHQGSLHAPGPTFRIEHDGSMVPLTLPGDSFVELQVIPHMTGAQYDVGWNTNISLAMSRDRRNYLIGAYCHGESGGDSLGSDEAGLENKSDGSDNGSGYHDDLDVSDTMNLTLSGLGFATTSKFVAKEYVGGLGGSVDNEGSIDILPLPRSAEELLEQRRTVHADGLELEVHFALVHSDLP